jgi:hypothetical protein
VRVGCIDWCRNYGSLFLYQSFLLLIADNGIVIVIIIVVVMERVCIVVVFVFGTAGPIVVFMIQGAFVITTAATIFIFGRSWNGLSFIGSEDAMVWFLWMRPLYLSLMGEKANDCIGKT